MAYTITTPTNIDAVTVRKGTRAATPWTRVTTTATVTLNNHQFSVNDVIYVSVSSDTGAISVGSKTITAVATNTFTFACTNAAGTSGTLTFTAADNFNINGGYLTIDQDYGIGSTAELDAVLGNVVLSASLGGTLDIDARAVRLIPYNTGTGNAPATGTTISQGGVSGKLIGVWSAVTAAPTQPGAAMPASGFIKVKQVTGGAYAAGALTGIGATATGADTVGWITITGLETNTLTVNRLNSFLTRGDWYEIGTTTGSNATTWQVPTSGKAVYIPGVWVETAASSGIYEFYPNTLSLGATAANVATSAAKGKVCWITSTGLVRFQNDGTNSTGGYLPVTGLKIRIPNIILQNAAAATQATVALPNATLATRYDLTTTGGGDISMSHVSCAWYLSISQAFAVALSDLSTFTQLLLNEIASPLTISNVGIGLEGVGPQTAFLMTLCFAGGTVANVVASRSTLASAATYVAVITDSIGFTFDNCIFKGNVIRANGSADGVNLQRCFDIDFDTCKLIGGGFVLATCARISFLDTIYHDHPVLTTNTTNPTFAWDMSAVCTDITIDGLTFDGLYMEAPYSGIVNIAAAGCARIKIRNLGTAADPLQCGTPEVFGQSWSRSTSTITVTHNAHGLKTGDIINVTQASDAAATPLGTKTVTVTGVNTFTYTGVSTGATSGTLAYYGANPATGISINNAAAANDVRIQRVYLRGLRGVAISCDNSTKNLLLESFWASPPSINAIGLAVLNGTFKNLGAVYNTTVQTAVYGTNFVDNHNADIMPDTTALSWSRVTTTCTVTLTDHRLKTNDLINVITSSSAAAVVLGQKVVTVLTKDTFTFACLNAGATSGTIDVQQTNGRVALFMNEDSPDTAISTIDAGTPKFTSAGALYAPNVNDQITFETPYYIIGHSAFGFNSPNIPGATNTNYDITYDLDQGSGYSGTFNNLLIARTGASGTNGAFTVTITDASSVNPGDYVSGTNVAPLAKVLSKASNTLTLDLANVGTVSGTLTFYHLPSETILDPAVGFKIKIRVKTVTANTSTINHINFLTVVTESDRAQTYALDTIPFTVNGLIAGSEVRAYAGTDPDTAIAIGGIESSGTSFTFEHSYGGSTGYIIVHKEDYEPIYVPLTYASEAESLLVQPRFDRNYGNP